MTLRKKTLLLITITVIGLIGVMYATSSYILLRGFAKVEEQDSQNNVKRVKDALSEEITKLNLTTRDWAEWNETYRFVQDANQAYITTYLSDVSIARLKLNLMLYVQRNGQIVFAKGYDLESEQNIPILDSFEPHLVNQTILRHSHTKSYTSGVVLLPEEPILIAARPILDSDSRGPMRGTLIMGRYLDPAAIKRLAARTHLSVTVHRFDDAQIPEDFRTMRSKLALTNNAILVQPLNPQTVAGYTILKDIYGNPALVMRVDSPRVIYAQGQASLRYFIFCLCVVALGFGVTTLLLIEKLVLARLFRLSADVYSIGTSGDLSFRVLSIAGKDELSSLANTINEMLEALEHTLHEQHQSKERFFRYDKVLAELAKRKIRECSDLTVSLREITEAAAHTLEVERVSVWLYTDEYFKKLRCIDVYQKNTDAHSAGDELTAIDYPVYFRALPQERTLAANDARIDPRTQELSQQYLGAYGITSMLDAAIWLGGHMVGVVCHEQIGEPRYWCSEEKNFAASVADLVSLTIEACERKRSQEALRKAHDDLELRVRERTAELARINEELQAEITERTIAEEKLLHEAFHDSLTGLPNRTMFMQRLAQALSRARRRHNYLFAVLFLDLDRFKLVNDSLGHLVGDQLLIAFVRRLEVCLRATDTVARLGGDEFVILLDDIRDVKDTTQVAERIQKELTLPFNLNQHEVFITVSIGIALSTIGYTKPEEILRDADTVMYRAKSLGKARHEVFDQEMHTRAVSQLHLENDLRRALERQELQIYYQPILSIVANDLTGFEALLRWEHPIRGLVSPTEFIPIAEETGLIVPIGYWVLRTACSQMRAWQKQFAMIPPITINVNVSGKQFAQPDLMKQISRILQETDFDASSLKLEITESVLIENSTSATVMLAQLKNLGIQVYIDDFGTGYSSLSYLNHFPVDVLKIDRSFISNISGDNENFELVRTIIRMAHNLRMNVVAEGIETPEQLTRLKALNCEYGQGYLFSKPLHKEAVKAWIEKTLAISNILAN